MKPLLPIIHQPYRQIQIAEEEQIYWRKIQKCLKSVTLSETQSEHTICILLLLALLKFCSSVLEFTFFSGISGFSGSNVTQTEDRHIIYSILITPIQDIDTDFCEDLCIFEFEFFVTDKL